LYAVVTLYQLLHQILTQQKTLLFVQRAGIQQPESLTTICLSLGPHCAYFRMQTLKPQVAKVSTVRVSRITDATVDAFATCGFNFRMRKYAQCGPRLTRIPQNVHIE